MEYTTNYQLPTWVETDRIQMDDFNDMTEKIDTALGEQSQELEALTAAVTGKGNCEIWTTTYTGNGKYGSDNPTQLVLPAKPVLLVIHTAGMYAISVLSTGNLSSVMSNGAVWGSNISWSENSKTLSYWSSHPDYQMNRSGQTYAAVALITKNI